MRKSILPAVALALLISACSLISPESTNGDGGGLATDIRLKFNKGNASAIVDTNTFILLVKSIKGDEIYHGEYSKAPGRIEATEGYYLIEATSGEAAPPDFETSRWGDRQYVFVHEGESVLVEMWCRKFSGGLKLEADSTVYALDGGSSIWVRTAEGETEYPQGERRFVHFNPGEASVVLKNSTNERTIYARRFNPGENLSLAISAENGNTRTDDTDTDDNDEEEIGIIDKTDTLTISEAINGGPHKEVWIGGFIVGGDLSAKSARYSIPFSSASNIMIGPRAQADSREGCIAVQLSAGSQARTLLNLVDNPDMLGRYVFIKGDIVESYYSMTGIKNITQIRIPTP